MILKDYQKRCLNDIKLYLQYLEDFKDKYDRYIEIDEDLAYDFDFPKRAWEQCKIKNTNGGSVEYNSKKNGLGEPLPNFCIKVPTGGGKTLLATRTLDLINTIYLKKNTGLVLWIVPTNQIYKQTIKCLKDREHSYRQVLDLSSGGRTLIMEKGDRFTAHDISDNLVVMMLMLPSANRQNKETLKIFQDTGGYETFFPNDDNFEEHGEILNKFSNLDYFGDSDSFWKQVKTSLGNVLRILKPIIIIDEGQKAYSENAQRTIRNFNPTIVVELSATPPKGSNPICPITGQDLNREEMIKLDINVINRSTSNWKDVVLSSVEKRNYLENCAKTYESQTGNYIRPICLIQVERTGKNQINSGYIHSEHVKEYLMNECGISSDEIAIKSSEKDDIEGIDLLLKDCSIRYIITKQALQEGWDCSFAYVLTVLTDTSAEMNITQLVGRVLRQPYAKKTKILDLDESYIYCYRPNTNEILKSIKSGLEGEGLGDIAGRITSVPEGGSDDSHREDTTTICYRDKFKKFEGKIYLPRFFIIDNSSYRELSYEMDILKRINWNEISFKSIETLVLSSENKNDIMISIALSENTDDLIDKKINPMKIAGLTIDYLFITRHIMNVVPNPWIAYNITEKALSILKSRYSDEIISANLVFIIQEINMMLEVQRDLLAEKLFVDLIKTNEILFFLQCDSKFALPSKNIVKKNTKKLTRDTGDQIDKSLFDFVPEDELNTLEQSVAVYIDKQQKLLWWYRNLSKQDYFIQGWKKGRIYPDFILSKAEDGNEDYSKVLVVETKGLHLKNEDTNYKMSVFDLCNELGRTISWDDLGEEFRNNTIEFEIIYDVEWQRKLNELFDVW